MENNIEVRIHFLGASGTVTGSKFLLEIPGKNILVDCGLFQGLKELRELNWEPFPFPAEKIDLVLLTHGHLDHTGYLPRLVKEGLRAPITGTAPTLAIASVIVLDSAKIQEEEAEEINEKGTGTHHPALPLYNLEDAERAINFFNPVEPDRWITLTDDIKYRFITNGHIIGSTFIEINIFGKIFLFSGDVGRKVDALLEKPNKPRWADYLFLESTYGNRMHPKEDVDTVITNAVKEVIKNKGNLIIPTFAVERLQTLMYTLWQLYLHNKIPNIPIYVDSPMGNNVLQIFQEFHSWHKLSHKEFMEMQRHFKIIRSYGDTWKTIDDKQTKIIIAGSGMVTGGRVLTYLRYLIEDPANIVMLIGFQAEGTRGRQLLEGAYEIKIMGKYVPVKAQIIHIESLSAHADQPELLEWVSDIKNIPEEVFLVHGEKLASDALRVKIKDQYKWKVYIPKLMEIRSIKFLQGEIDALP
ncbi:MAG TPA: MBL fold metallo-hydrolase [Gillisia sp.]|nr:MBL fold metallo-hydrolase [Gillisia sp.]